MSSTCWSLATKIWDASDHLDEALDAAVNALHAGECVGMPTETVYGLAANALNPKAVARVFEVKERPAFDPLIVHVTPEMELSRWVKVNGTAQALIDHFWPGPLTLLMEKTDAISDLVTSGHPTVAVRSPSHPVARALLNRFGGPLVAPSANLFGSLSPTTAQAVADGLWARLSVILDGGPCGVGIESTIVNTTLSYPELPILRLGGIASDTLSALGYDLSFPTPIIGQSPGTLKNHYAPRLPLYLWDCQNEDKADQGQLYTSLPLDCSQYAFLGWSETREEFKTSVVLSAKGDSIEAASRLFSLLRSLDQGDTEGIVAELPPLEGLGAAITDRLRRGASGFVVHQGQSWLKERQGS